MGESRRSEGMGGSTVGMQFMRGDFFLMCEKDTHNKTLTTIQSITFCG